MTMLLDPQSPIMPFSVRSGILRFLASFRRLVNDWVAAAIDHRERQAAIVALRHLDDRELKDIGIYRCQIDTVIAEAAEARMKSLHHS